LKRKWQSVKKGPNQKIKRDEQERKREGEGKQSENNNTIQITKNKKG